MSKRPGTYRKAQKNPEGVCQIKGCGIKIVGKMRSSIHCKSCNKIIEEIQRRCSELAYRKRKEFPDHDIQIKVIVKRKDAKIKNIESNN